MVLIIKEQGAGLGVEPDHAQQQSKVADAGGDEGLLGGGCGAGFVVPETNEQVGRQADEFPTNKQQQQTVRDHYPEHGGREERQETEETGEVFVVRHVAEAVDENEQTDEGDHDEHDRSQRIEDPAELDPRIAELQPIEIVGLADLAEVSGVLNGVDQGDDGRDQGQKHRTYGRVGGELAMALFGQRAQARRQQRQRGDHPQVFEDQIHFTPSWNLSRPRSRSCSGGKWK